MEGEKFIVWETKYPILLTEGKTPLLSEPFPKTNFEDYQWTVQLSASNVKNGVSFKYYIFQTGLNGKRLRKPTFSSVTAELINDKKEVYKSMSRPSCICTAHCFTHVIPNKKLLDFLKSITFRCCVTEYKRDQLTSLDKIAPKEKSIPLQHLVNQTPNEISVAPTKSTKKRRRKKKKHLEPVPSVTPTESIKEERYENKKQLEPVPSVKQVQQKPLRDWRQQEPIENWKPRDREPIRDWRLNNEGRRDWGVCGRMEAEPLRGRRQIQEEESLSERTRNAEEFSVQRMPVAQEHLLGQRGTKEDEPFPERRQSTREYPPERSPTLQEHFPNWRLNSENVPSWKVKETAPIPYSKEKVDEPVPYSEQEVEKHIPYSELEPVHQEKPTKPVEPELVHQEKLTKPRPDSLDYNTVLKVMWNEKIGTDVIVISKNKIHRCHYAVLCVMVPIFKEIFDGKKIKILDLSETHGSESVEDFLCYIYTRETPQLATTARELLTLARKYHLPDLMAVCREQLLINYYQKLGKKTTMVK